MHIQSNATVSVYRRYFSRIQWKHIHRSSSNSSDNSISIHSALFVHQSVRLIYYLISFSSLNLLNWLHAHFHVYWRKSKLKITSSMINCSSMLYHVLYSFILSIFHWENKEPSEFIWLTKQVTVSKPSHSLGVG